MIAVIADDFSGAAELAGIGFCHHLAAEVHTELDARCSADLVAVDTDSRRLPAVEAAEAVAGAVLGLDPQRPALWFKKVDSLLRGPVLAELRAIMAGTGRRRAILAAANPSRNRVIREGRYFVDGRPLDQSALASDFEHPARSARVLDLLGAGQDADVFLRRPGQHLPPSGIVVAEAASPADLAQWAACVDASTLPAGAADFFTAVLRAAGFPPAEPARPTAPAGGGEERPPIGGLTLMVCGSAAAWASGRREECAKAGIPVVPLADLPAADLSDEQLAQWAGAARAALETRGVAMLAVGEQPPASSAAPRRLLEHLVRVAAQVVRERGVDRLLVEGGETASALVRRLGWSQSRVTCQHAPGIVSLVPSGEPTTITVKPGSYAWPQGPMISPSRRGVRPNRRQNSS